jgi:hypothetical protein
MSIANPSIATELISDFAAGRLDEADAGAVREAIDPRLLQEARDRDVNLIATEKSK